jgi:4-hydroxy-2-oxoheptanedioate aldolase
MAFAMIETREAMAICGDILALPGIDGVFIGPSDLSIALSGGASVDPMSKSVDDAITEVVRQASKAGKPVAVYAHTAERGRDFLKLGAKMICIQSDLGFLKVGAQVALDIIRR